MGQKDITQKSLEGFPDVFADIINALLYQGETVVREENLFPFATESFFPVTGHRLKNQFQDVSMMEYQRKLPLAQYTIENQSSTDYRMVLRNAGYEGACYRRANSMKNPYPFIGIVLNWGKKVWKGKTSIHDYFSERTALRQTLRYINNMRYPVYDMRYLTPEVRAGFHSDMRIIVDFLAEQDKDKIKGGYEPPKQKMKHPEEVLSMLKALAGDERFEEIWKRFKEQAEKEAAGKEGITMCRLLDSYWDDGVNTGMERGKALGKAEGLAEGKVQGRINTLIANLKILMEKLNLTLTQSMDMLDVADDDRLTILEHFKQA